MKNVNRRQFLKTSFVGATLATVGQSALANKFDSRLGESTILKQNNFDKTDIDLKISLQESTAPGNTLKEKFDFMERHGVVGFEPGGKGLLQRVPELQKELKDRAINVSAVCAGFDGFVLSTDETIRKQFHNTMRDIIIAAGELESTGVIFVPAFNHQKPVMQHTMETRDFLCDEINKLGDIAIKYGTTVIFEPLNRKEAFYLRQVADAASICSDINNPGVRCMGDFWHMTWEETSDSAAFLSAGNYLQHVHIASRKRRSMPGEDGVADNYIDGFRGLKKIGYNKYVSFECGCQGDREVVVLEALQLIRKQWSKA